MQQAAFILKPEIFLPHTAQRNFIGPGAIRLENGDILMMAPWGRPPANFEQLAATFPVPMLYRSSDDGRTWREAGQPDLHWSLAGMISDGGITFLRLLDGRLALLAHRHVQHLHGGGLPAIAFSQDDGQTWIAARTIGEPEGVWYVMNERMIQLPAGRLVVPVSHMPKGMGTYEGDRNLGLCFFSDDGGATWSRSQTPADLCNDLRGMAEPCVAHIAGNRLLMLARTGQGSVYQSWSPDGGDTWSAPAPTTLAAACSSLTLKTLPDGRLIVFYNHTKPRAAGSFFPRTPLVYAVSPDQGRTWGEPVAIDREGEEHHDRQVIYPSICFTPEGMLVIYSLHAADPAGTFANGGPEGWKIGGGKRCIIEYPR